MISKSRAQESEFYSESIDSPSELESQFGEIDGVRQKLQESLKSQLTELISSIEQLPYKDRSVQTIVKDLYKIIHKLQMQTTVINKKHRRAKAILNALEESEELQRLRETQIEGLAEYFREQDIAQKETEEMAKMTLHNFFNIELFHKK